MAKSFSFTYSKLKNYEKCPLQHKVVDLDRAPGTEAGGDAIDYGNRVHKALSDVLKRKLSLPGSMAYLQYWIDYVQGLPGEHFIEDGWALDSNYQPTEYFGPLAWLRLKVDVGVVDGRRGWLVDWKTGQRLEEPLQLWLGAVVMFAKFPSLQIIDSMFVWLKEDDGKNSHECISAEVIKRGQIGEVWENILPRVRTYEESVRTGSFIAIPGRHCKYCRVTSCEFFGKAS